MKYPATWEEYKAQKQNRKAAGDSTAASGSSPLPATWEEYKAQKQAKAQQLPATQTDTAEREKCLNASGFKAMQTDIQGLFGTMDGYFSTYHKIGASSKWQKDQVSKMLQNVAQEKDYFNRYADVMGEDAQSYQKQLNAWEAQLKRYQKAMNGQEDDEGSLALGSGIARFQTEADAYFKKAQETTAGMSEPERANQWVSGAQTLLTEAQEIEAYLKQKNTPAAQTLMTQMAEYRKALEDMQTSARGAQLTNPLTGKAMPDVAISGRMRLPRYTADGKVQTGYGSAYDRRLGQQEERTLAAGMERKAEKADWQNQTVQQHEDYIRQDFEELKAFTHGDVSDSQAQNIHAGIFTEIAERLNYLALSGKCTESEYEALLDKVEQWKKEYLSGLPKSDMMWANSGIDDIRQEAKSLLPSKGDAMKEFRYQSGNLTRENIAYTPVDELLGKMGFDHGGTDWGTSDAERRAVTFLSEEVLPEYLANTEMTQEQYDAFMQKIADAPNAEELRETREANGLNANEAGMQSALEMYRKIDAKTYADMAGTGAVNAMENVMTKYAGGMEQVLMRGLGYLTKAAGKTLNLFGLAENPVGNYFVEGGQQGIDYENKDWQAGKQREYEAGRYASELTQNGSKFTKFTANMTRDLTQAALEMAAAGAIAGQISAGNTALSQLSQGGKYASSLANAQKRVSGYTKFAGQMANLMKNSSNVLISANAALNSYGEAEDAGRSMPERAVKLIAGGLIEYGTNGLFGGNPIVDPENAGLISKYITDLTDNETIRKIVSSKVFDRIGEGLEEVASAVAGAALDYALTGETDLTAKELVDEFTVGVLLSMVMSAPEDIVDLTARAKSYVQSKVITRFGKQAQSNLDVLYGTMAQYTAQYYAGDENLMRFNGWSESQIKKAKGEWNTIVREFNTLADRLESAQNITESFERYTPPQANGGFVDVEMQNIIRAEQQSNAALMTDRALDIQIITQRATIEALRGSTDATDIFMAESAQNYLDVLDAEKSARAAERAQRAAESAAQENIPTAEQTAQETPQAAQETAQSAAATVEQAEEINAPAAQETEGGMSNEQSQSVNENQERNERVGAEGQNGGVVESGSRIAADRGGTGEAGGNESENLRRQKLNERVERFKGTVLDTGMDKLTADGDPDVMVGIVPVRKYTQAMKQAQREAKEQGVKTTFVVGTMSIKGEDGEYHNTDAMFDAESGRIFVSVSSIYEPEVLMEHEIFHAKVHAAEIDLVTALESVSENMTAEEYTEIVEQYMKAYRGAYDSDTAVYEEILADAYAGLNRFANRSFKKLIDAMRTHAAGMQSQRESNAPTEEVSQAVRRTQDSDGNEKTAREGGKRASIDRYSYQGKSMTENSEIYSYDFLTHQPDMKVVELPALDSVKTNGKIDKEKTVAHGIENAKAIGEGMSDTVASVTNLYAVTDYLKSKGYDGIKDVGGKGGGEGHTVWIPFTGKQVKSAEAAVYTDDGELIPLSQRFKANKRDIRYSLTPTEKAQRAQERAETAAAKAEEAKQAAQESYKRELTGGLKKLFEVQSYDNEALGKLLEAPMAEMQQGVKLLKAEKDDLFEALMDLGTATLPADDYYREIREALRGRRIFVPEGIREDFGDDWGDFRKKAFSSGIYFTDKASDRSVDVHMLELADAYPSEFTEEYIASEMLRQIVDAAEKGKDKRMSLRKGMEENEKRFGLKREEQLEYQRQEFEKLLNSYAEKAGRDARIAQDKAAKAEADERLESLIREADGERPAKKPEGITEPWTISEAAAQKRGFPYLNGKQVYPLRTWVKAADMGNYGLVLDKSTKKGMLTVLFTNKETGLSSVKDMETKLLTAVEPKYQPSVQETAALLASMPPEKLEDAADAEDLGAFYEWYDGQTEGRETNDLRPVAEERAEKSRQAAQEIEKQRGESVLEKQEAYEQKKAERIEGIRKAYLESFGTTEPKLPYGKDRPMQSRFTTLQPGEALSLLQAMTGTKWALTNNADGTWKATMTKDPAPKTSISPKEALERLEAAKKTYGQQIPGVHPEGIAKENFKGSPALEKAGVKIDGGIADYGQVETMRKGAETRRSVKWQIDKTIQRMDAKKPEIRAAKKIASGRSEYYRLPDNCRPEVVSQLAALYLNERMTGEDLIQVRKSEIRDGLFYKMMELFPTENEIMANPELFKAEKLLVLNYRTALRSMVNIFGEERGMEIYNYLFAPVIRNTAESYRWTNQQFDDVKEFTDSSGKKSRLNETERAYVHMMLDVEGYVEKAERSERGDILKDAAKKVAKGESISNETIEFALNSEEAKIVEKYAQWINGKDTEGIDKKKCENAMQEYRKKFDLYFEAINDFLVAHGMQPIGRIQGYTPHMPLAEKFNFVQKALDKLWNALGVKDETVTTLPAEISGRTEFFRPQKRWNPFFLERKTDKTAYDIEEAFQNYVRYLGDILFHTDDIQKVRAAESYLRKGLRGNFVDDLQKAIDMSRSSDKEEKIEYLQKMEQIGADDYDLSDAEMMQVFDRLIAELVGEKANETRYSPLVIWLKNYGDILAGKQFGGDRGMEYTGGRKWLNIGNKLVNAFAKANVAGNLSSVLNQSAQLAMLQATRSQRAILKATQEFCTGKLGEFRKEIDFLTGKKGIDYLVQSGTDKFISGMFAPAEFMDSMLSTIATRAAYWDAIQNGKNHEEAMRFADWYGRALMGDRTKGAKPLMFFSKNPFVRMLNVFQIEPLNTVEFVTQDMPLEIKREAKEHGKKSAARMLLRTIFGYLIAAFVLNRLTDELYGGTPAPLDIAGLTANFFASGKGLPTNDYIKNLINKVVGSEIFDVQEPKEGFDTSAAIKDTGYNLMNEIPFASNASGLLGVGDRSMPFPNIFGTGKNFYDALFPGNGKSANGQEVLEKGLEFLAELVPGGRQAKKTGYGIKAIAQGGKTKGYGDNERLLFALDTDNVWNDIRTVLFGTNATPEANRYYAGDSYGLNADQTKLWKELRDEGVNGYMLYGLMMRMDDAMNYSDIPEPKDDESEEEKAKRLQQKEEHRKKARAELAAQEGLTDGQRMRIYSAMVENGKNDAIDKLLDAGMKWKDISEILDKRGELKAGKTESEWAAEFASWLDGKKYSGKNREAINEALVPQSASFYNKMTAAGVGKNSAIKIEEIARKAAKADGKNFSEAYQARAVAQAGLSENEAYKALCAIYSDGTAEKFKEAHEAGIPAKEYTKFWLAQAELESDRDEDGEFISGSKREKVIELIDSLNLTAEQKDWIMSQKYKSYDWWMMPWS